jgi:large subunit ribosomal protein L25
MNEVEVSCLPKDLPEKLEVDVINLKLDDMLYLEDIELPEGVELPQLTQEEPVNDPIVAVRLLRIAEEEIEPEVDEEGLEEGEEGVEGTEGEESTEATSEGDTEENKEEG